MKMRELLLHLMDNYKLDDEILEEKSLYKEAGYPITRDNPYGLQFVHSVKLEIERREATVEEAEKCMKGMQEMGINIYKEDPRKLP